ncbi:MAG: hypothetical protein ABSH48_28350, partial [Verrucomicrobiota bacterium]
YGDVIPGFTQPLAGSVGGYLKNQGVYKCPADLSTWPKSGANAVPRVRSCSMNCYMGTTKWESENPNEIAPGYFIFRKFSIFPAGLGPADAMTIVDENPLSINDGFLLISEPSGGNDHPAVNHGQSSTITSADGHAMLHKWRDALLTNPAGSTGSDFAWLAAHVSIKIQ